ncbi:phosphoenolpyruvate--protein phosphotransferase [candidate division WOR-3 bacterium]|nr:phosphoenolpyruvate--protein phosphotransferase [candidate division WOR-3 bacterium]
MRNKLLRGIPASPGIVIAKAIPHEEERFFISTKRSKKTSSEINRFKNAREQTRKEIQLLREDFLKKTDSHHAMIFDAQLLVLEDKTLVDNTVSRIRKGESAEFAFKKVADKILLDFNKIEDEYLKARINDIKDVAFRILSNLTNPPAKAKWRAGKITASPRARRIDKLSPKIKHIVIAQDLTPSETANFSNPSADGQVVGFATDFGGDTSHTAIMARALEIPAVVGLNEVTKFVNIGDEVVIDGNQGLVIIEPNESTRRVYERKIKHFQQYTKELKALSGLNCETLDGHSVELSCNIELPEEIDIGLAYGARGVGLMRTEFLYLKSDNPPSEDEQYEIYNAIAQKTYPNSLIIRTLDLGGDKLPLGTGVCAEGTSLPDKWLRPASLVGTGQAGAFGGKDANPFLGWRAIRFSLSNKEFFSIQLKAILRANKHGNVKILFPLITNLNELRLAKSCLEEAKNELKKNGLPYDPNIEVGAMIEVPGAALLAPAIAKEADFLSIGSNDLTQYTLACDRTNPRVADLFNPFHPAVLRLIKYTIEAGHEARKWVGLCGELGANFLAVPILLGMGIDELSVAPIYILEIKKIVRALSMEEAKIIAKEVMLLETSEKVQNFIEKIRTKFPVIQKVMAERKS